MPPRRPNHRRADPAELSARAFPLFLVVSLGLHGTLVGGLAVWGFRHVAAAGPATEDVAREPEALTLDLRTYRDSSTLVIAPEPPLTSTEVPTAARELDTFEPEPLDAEPLLTEPLQSMVVASSTPPLFGERAPEVSWIGLAGGPAPKLPPRDPAPTAVGKGDGAGDAGSPDSIDAPVGASGTGTPDGAGLVPTAPSVGPPDTGAGFVAGDAPLYPKLSQRLGEEGSVVLRVTLDTTGAVIAATVETSSGFPRLDEAAIVAVKLWRFRPATHAGVAVATTFLHTVTFRLVQQR